MEAARKRKMQKNIQAVFYSTSTIQAVGLSRDQTKEVAMGMKGCHGLKELNLRGGPLGHVGGHSVLNMLEALVR